MPGSDAGRGKQQEAEEKSRRSGHAEARRGVTTSGSERRKFYRHRREGGTTSREKRSQAAVWGSHSVVEGARTTPSSDSTTHLEITEGRLHVKLDQKSRLGVVRRVHAPTRIGIGWLLGWIVPLRNSGFLGRGCTGRDPPPASARSDILALACPRICQRRPSARAKKRGAQKGRTGHPYCNSLQIDANEEIELTA